MNIKNSKFLSIWFWWIVLTTIYLVGFVSTPDSWNRLVGLVGLFVPFGFFNSILLYANIIFVLIFFGILYLFEKITKKYQPHPAIKIIANLLLLLVITYLVDNFLWGDWCSMNLFLHGELCSPI